MRKLLMSTCLLTVFTFTTIVNAAPPSLNDGSSVSEVKGSQTNAKRPQPCEKRPGFYFKFTGAALLPNETGIGSFTDSWQYADSDGGVTALSKPSQATYKFAAAGLIGCNVPESSNFFEAEYFWLSNSQHNFNDTSDGPLSFGSVFFNVALPTPPGTTLVSDAYLKYQVNQVDLRAGHAFVTAKKRLELFPSVGIRWSDLTHALTFLVGNVKTSYWGVGPAFSVETLYKIWKGLKLSTHFDANLLIGNVKAHSLLNFGAISRYKSPSTSRIVPSFGAKLGLSYGCTFWKQSSFQVEAGYQVATYLGVFDILTGFVANPLVVPPVIQRIASITSDNFSYSGPYASLGFLF